MNSVIVGENILGSPDESCLPAFEVIRCPAEDAQPVSVTSEKSFVGVGGGDTGERNKGDEVSWLSEVVRRVSPATLGHLVAHRGFHDTSDNVWRPVENTLNVRDASFIFIAEFPSGNEPTFD